MVPLVQPARMASMGMLASMVETALMVAMVLTVQMVAMVPMASWAAMVSTVRIASMVAEVREVSEAPLSLVATEVARCCRHALGHDRDRHREARRP